MTKQMSTMKFYTHVVCFAMVAMVITSAIPKPESKEETLKQQHFDRPYDRELSDDEHFVDGEHNDDYDHEAFLGKDEAHMFDELTPEESKQKLSIIYDKIDKDKDNKLTETELRDWIKYVQYKYVEDDTNRQWDEHEAEIDNTLTWEKYKKRTYGFIEDDDNSDDYSYAEMIARDEKRWKTADLNKDDKLNKKEFADFLHPEDAKHMREIVIDETLEDIDKDKDGKISLDEYIEDMWPQEDREQQEPEWVTTERKEFQEHRDKNKDGFMDREETASWIMPDDYDHSNAEARHLIHEADGDKDGVLTKEEVLNKYDVFVGSQATDFGEALNRHDEF